MCCKCAIYYTNVLIIILTASLVRGPNLALILVECSLVVVRLLEWAVGVSCWCLAVGVSCCCGLLGLLFRRYITLCPHSCEHTKIAGILFSTRNLLVLAVGVGCWCELLGSGRWCLTVGVRLLVLFRRLITLCPHSCKHKNCGYTFFYPQSDGVWPLVWAVGVGCWCELLVLLFRRHIALCPHSCKYTKIAGILFSTRNLMMSGRWCELLVSDCWCELLEWAVGVAISTAHHPLPPLL